MNKCSKIASKFTFRFKVNEHGKMSIETLYRYFRRNRSRDHRYSAWTLLIKRWSCRLTRRSNCHSVQVWQRWVLFCLSNRSNYFLIFSFLSSSSWLLKLSSSEHRRFDEKFATKTTPSWSSSISFLYVLCFPSSYDWPLLGQLITRIQTNHEN